MTSLSKENAAEESPRKKKQTVVGSILKELPEEIFLVVLSFVDFVTLCRVKPVCKWWKDSIDQGIEARLGKKPFMLEDKQEQDSHGLECNVLCSAVIKYCFCKGHEITSDSNFIARTSDSNNFIAIIKPKSEYAEELASTYGWPIGKWDVSQVTNFRTVFAFMRGFNEDIGDWNVSKATNFESMFFDASSFNQDLSSWNTGNVKDMSAMFYGATSFNQDLSPWNTGNVVKMICMFYSASSFNQDISSWNVTRVEDYEGYERHGYMFFGATSFNLGFSPHFESDE